MEYNSQREKLLLPEYGRNIQEMIRHAIALKDDEERNRAARTIISVMSQTNPGNKDIEDFNHKLWDHLYIISGYQLEVDSPFPKPEPEEKRKPEKISYPHQKIKYRHYGKNIEYFIEKAREMEDPEMRDKFAEVLANLMKRSYLNWNRDSVNDELIKDHLRELSNGELEFKDSHRMVSTNEILGLNKKKPVQQVQQNPKQGGGFKKFGSNQNRGKKFGGGGGGQQRDNNFKPRPKY